MHQPAPALQPVPVSSTFAVVDFGAHASPRYFAVEAFCELPTAGSRAYTNVALAIAFTMPAVSPEPPPSRS